MLEAIIYVLLNLLMNPIVWGGIILLIFFLVKGRKKTSEPDNTDIETLDEEETPEESDPTPVNSQPEPSKPAESSYTGTSKIFVNGGAPASGSKMGKVSVDGTPVYIYYNEAPVEITISAGRHHVVVEGGVYGDARIDRFIDFGVTDVWTVDLPGGDDADVIRHQMISTSEYRSALSTSGFQVTKRRI